MLEARIESLLVEMTVEERMSLLAGRDFWTTLRIERLNIPSIKVSDGPNGARGLHAAIRSGGEARRSTEGSVR
jgi:beta-glucosidase